MVSDNSAKFSYLRPSHFYGLLAAFDLTGQERVSRSVFVRRLCESPVPALRNFLDRRKADACSPNLTVFSLILDFQRVSRISHEEMHLGQMS